MSTILNAGGFIFANLSLDCLWNLEYRGKRIEVDF